MAALEQLAVQNKQLVKVKFVKKKSEKSFKIGQIKEFSARKKVVTKLPRTFLRRIFGMNADDRLHRAGERVKQIR